MGNARGVKRDFGALERRRFDALKLLKQGYNQSEVARRVMVCSQTVSRWVSGVSVKCPDSSNRPWVPFSFVTLLRTLVRPNSTGAAGLMEATSNVV